MPRRERKAASAGACARLAPSSDLSATPIPSGPAAQSRPSAPPFASQPGAARMRRIVDAVGTADEVGPRAHRRCDPRSPPGSDSKRRERVRHPLERERERDDAAAVGAGRERVRLDLGGLDVRPRGTRRWTGCSGRSVALASANLRARQSASMPAWLPGAVVVDASPAAGPPAGRARGRPRSPRPERAACAPRPPARPCRDGRRRRSRARRPAGRRGRERAGAPAAASRTSA